MFKIKGYYVVIHFIKIMTNLFAMLVYQNVGKYCRKQTILALHKLLVSNLVIILREIMYYCSTKEMHTIPIIFLLHSVFLFLFGRGTGVTDVSFLGGGGGGRNCFTIPPTTGKINETLHSYHYSY